MFVDEGLALPTQHAYTFGAAVLRPTSRGKVFLRSLLPTAQPHIVHGYLTTDQDRAAFCRAMRLLLEIAAQPALTRVRRGDLRVPASDRDADLLEFVQRHCHTLYHPVGTCAIGSVVDSQLRGAGSAGACGWSTPR
jgi:choline dehydrogenase